LYDGFFPILLVVVNIAAGDMRNDTKQVGKRERGG